jgi:periplasmic protein TonB
MRLYTIVVSSVAHVAALVVLVGIPLVVMDAVPGVRDIGPYIRADAAELPDPPPPPRPRRLDAPASDIARDLAPTVAPDRIAPEVETPSAERGVPFDGPPGIPDGDPAGVLLSAAPVPAPPPVVPIRAGGIIRAPKKIVDVPPVYPEIARRARIEGKVILDAVIGENGRVRDIRVLHSEPLLDAAAMDAVRQWQFTPTLLNGQPVSVIMTVTVAFRLN